MRAVVQRVTHGSVEVDGELVAQIGGGLVVLLGVGRGDSAADCELIADKVAQLRVFPDQAGMMNRSVLEFGGEILLVSQFTLYGDVRRGRRPSFGEAAVPDEARQLYDRCGELLRAKGLRVETGVFGAAMALALVNDGPVTLLLDSRKAF